ncbi:MAG: hypothetical protein ACOX2O_04240 [Bdellovibrionota bacterium]
MPTPYVVYVDLLLPMPTWFHQDWHYGRAFIKIDITGRNVPAHP